MERMGFRVYAVSAVCVLSLACSEDAPVDATGSGGTAGGGVTTSGGAGGSGASGGNDTSTTSGGAGAGGEGRDYSSDRDAFFGDSRCDAAGLLLCDDFEAGTIDSATWSTQGAVPTLDTTRAARGSQSLHFATQQNGLSLLRTTSIFPVTDNTYWGRMFVWIDALPIAPDWAHWTIVGADGADVPGEIRVGGQYHTFQQRNLWGVGTDGGATGDWTYLDDDPRGNAVTAPTQAWVCIEWLHDGQNHETRFYWDAIEHPSLATTASEHGGDQGADYLLPTFDSVWVGWWLYQGGPDPDHYDVWIDEVALDTIRIGCVL